MVAKILGPTADYIGEGLQLWAKARVTNVKQIFSNAEEKLGDRLELDGTVSPRVLKEILQEGSYADDAVGIEYWGGILASSRSESEQDDRGAAWAKLLAGLSTYALRTHFVVYSQIAIEFSGYPIRRNRDLRYHRVWIEREEFVAAIGLSEEAASTMDSVAAHVFFALHTYDLLGPSEWNCRLEDGGPLGVLASPSAQGAELFLWAIGEGRSTTYTSLFDGWATAIPNVVDVRKPETVYRLDPPDDLLKRRP